ncbi:MAG: CS1-pili formation C-terminal domain-containing protein [Shewanella oncorhynchi]
MKSLSKIYLAIIYVYPSLAISAQPPVPAEFAELYQVVEKKVKFKDLSGVYHNVTMKAGYDSVQVSDVDAKDALRAILTSNNVKTTVISDIVSDLSVGVKNGTQCTGNIDSCIVQPEKYAILYDFYTNVVHFYINPEYLDINDALNDSAVTYANPIKSDWGLINHVNSYVSKSNSSDSNLSFYNESTVGLPYGNIDSEFYYQSSSNDIELDKLIYNYEFERYRVLAGLSRDQLDINSTDFLTSGTLNKETSITFANSNNMVVGKREATQKIFYFAPSDGVLTVYRGDRIIYQKNVPSGQGYISNTDLPNGRYDVIFELKVGGQVISQETKTIYNGSSDTLAVKGSDFAISAGIFNKTFERFGVSNNIVDLDGASQSDIRQDDQSNLKGQGFLRGLYTYRPFEPLVLGIGEVVSDAENATNFGIKAQLPRGAELSLSSRFFSQGATYYDSYFSVDDWSLSYQKFNMEENSVLARYYYGDASYSQSYLSKGFRISRNIQAYLNYSYYTNDGNDVNNGYTSSMLSTGITLFTIGNSTLQVNANYDFEGGNNFQDKFSTQLVFTMPLSGELSVESRLVTGKGGVSSFSNNLQSGNLLDESEGAYGAMRVGNNYYPNGADSSVFDASANASLSTEKYNASAYGYLSEAGDYSGSANFSSSQIVTSSGVAMTSKKANSYLVVDSDSKLKNDQRYDGVKGLLIIDADDRGSSKKVLRENIEVIPLKDYQSYRAVLDTESVDLNNTGDTNAEAFTMPGTVAHIKSNVTRVLSFVSGFKDLYNNSISDIRCEGEGCVTEDQVVEGIYKVSVMEGIPFKLTNNNLVCFIPQVDKAELFNFGENYCIPAIEPTEQTVVFNGKKNINLTFLGAFTQDQYKNQLKKYIDRLTISGDNLIDRVIGNNVYVYVSSDGELTVQQQSVIDEMERYVLRNGFHQKQHMYSLAKI